jgi:hypothetical protein
VAARSLVPRLHSSQFRLIVCSTKRDTHSSLNKLAETEVQEDHVWRVTVVARLGSGDTRRQRVAASQILTRHYL